jgi:N-acetylmuramoyl-L-alanine amidase
MIIDLIPEGSNNRPGVMIKPQGITVHNTGNPGATAINHGAYLKGAVARRKPVSWHYTVDDMHVVKHLPNSEMGYHTGTAMGNFLTVGVEVCEVKDQASANKRAIKLCRHLMDTYGFSTKNIYQHWHWNRKNCPRLLRPIWEEFISMLEHPKITREVEGKVNGQPLNGYIIDGLTYVPIRRLGEIIRAKVEWDGRFKLTTIGQALQSEINAMRAAIKAASSKLDPFRD